MSFELFQLRYAVLTADLRSFNRAAQALGVRQATVSQHISRIEDVLGVRLFKRSPRGATPTRAGAVFVRRARRILGETDELRHITREIGLGTKGRLGVGFYTSLSTGHLRATLDDYRREYPGVTMALVEDGRAALYQALDGGDIDVAIVSGCGCATSYANLPVWSEMVVAVIPRHHRLAERQNLQWTDLRGETFMLSYHDPGPDFADMLRAKIGMPGEPPDIRFHHVSRDTLFHLVGGVGIGITCTAAVKALPPYLLARPLFEGTSASSLNHSIVWREENDNPALRSFLDLVARRYPSMGE